MYGAGLERIVELADAGTRDEMSKDSLVAGLLMIHDLYPVPIEERVIQALDTVRPYMESHGGNVELLGLHGYESAVGVWTTFRTEPVPPYMCTPHGRQGSNERTALMMSIPLKFSGPFSSKIGVFCTASS